MRLSLFALLLACGVVAVPARAQVTLTIRYTLTSQLSPHPDNFFGNVARITDGDGDGTDDIVVNDLGPSSANLRFVSGDTGIPFRVISGPRSSEIGFPFTEVGDATGDGVPDYIVGAPYEWDDGEVGAAYLYDGATALRVWRVRSPLRTAYGRFGQTAAPLGDADGDGFADVMIGEPGDSEVHAFSGATGVYLYNVQSNQSGYAETLVSLGDLDGDGVHEIAVSSATAPTCWYCGRVWILSGATGAVRLVLDAPQATSFAGFGLSMGAVDDADGDGLRDLAVTASGYDTATTVNVGRVYVLSSVTGAVVRTFDPPAADVASDSVRAFGQALATGADLDGDGVGDVAVTARRSGQAGATRVYLLSGATGAVLGTAESPAPERLGYYGNQLALLGGAGGRLVVSAPYEDVDGVPNAGRVYVYGLGDSTVAQAPSPEAGGLSVAVAVAPNPSAGAAWASVTVAQASPVRVAVVDALGRVVAVLHDGPVAAGGLRLALPTGLAAGVYAVVAEGAEAVARARWVVAR